MISFVTFLLGIVVGVVEVAVMVGPEVASVEFRLDDRLVGNVEEEPWALSVDLGKIPAPRELVAVARDSDGEEIGRAVQWVNMPRAWAELEMALFGVKGSDRLFASAAWANVGGRNPIEVRASVNGVPLEVSNPSRIPLPEVNLDEVNFIRIEAEFTDAGTVSREMVFGGRYVHQANAELSSVAVALTKPGEPAPDDIRMQAGGSEIPVVAVEKGTADLIVVVDPRARSSLPGLSSAGRASPASPFLISTTDVHLTPLKPEINLRLLWPVPLGPEGGEGAGLDYRLFPSSPRDAPPEAGGLLWHLANARFPASKGRTRLADAVAVAGVMALEGGRRRTVVLLHGGSASEGSYSPEAVRSYLEQLRVPLVVWSTRLPTAAMRREWGDVSFIDSRGGLTEAWMDLLADLDRQRIVWVEGHHLPSTLEVAGGEVRLAGVEEP
jgi:hypothetical protein